MKKTAQALIEGREGAPAELRGPVFDAWLFDIIMGLLEPMQKDVLEWLLAAGSEGMDTSELCERANTLATRMGSCTSRLRQLGLIHTEMRTDRPGQYAHHTAIGWVLRANRMSLQLAREAGR